MESSSSKGCGNSFIPRIGTRIRTCSQKCWNAINKNENSPAWKGDAVGYSGLHRWVASRLGKPRRCTRCNLEMEMKFMHWHNISGEYKRDLSDWLRLCIRCHRKIHTGWEKKTTKTAVLSEKK